MLYPDSTRRIEEVNNIADLFAKKGFPKTANEVESYPNILREPEFPSDFTSGFDEIARALYFFSKVTKSNIPKASKLAKKQVGDILNEFSTVPVFLENWEEKKHIRNAIAHATTYYDPVKDDVRFVDAPSHYDKTKSLKDFMLIALEFDDVVASFSYVISLLGLLDLITIKNLKFA